MGVVSALGRNLKIDNRVYINLIQTDASINPGNSGGALLDTEGNPLGIVTAIYGEGRGIGFAIPADTARNVMEALVTKGKVSRGYIGVEPRDAPDGDGSLIAGVLRNGPADEAGILPGDVVVAVNDRNVRNMTELMQTVAAIAPGTQAKFKLQRQGKTAEVVVKIAERPSAAPKR
jgi:serine protease DegQ